MIQLLEQGSYTLIETKGQTKILKLGKRLFAWVNLAEIGEILITSHKSHDIDHVLAIGKYRLYDVKHEPNLTDLPHLELHVGNGTWQGYLLPTGLPSTNDKRKRIIPTKEVITKVTI